MSTPNTIHQINTNTITLNTYRQSRQETSRKKRRTFHPHIQNSSILPSTNLAFTPSNRRRPPDADHVST